MKVVRLVCNDRFHEFKYVSNVTVVDFIPVQELTTNQQSTLQEILSLLPIQTPPKIVLIRVYRSWVTCDLLQAKYAIEHWLEQKLLCHFAKP